MPPKATKALCVGMWRVPVHNVLSTTADGSLKTHGMVHLGKESGVARWLEKALFEDGKVGDGVKHLKVPLFQEAFHAVSALRWRRRANAWVGRDGKVLPALLSIKVRGKKLLVGNDLRCLSVALADDVPLLDWILTQIWEDLAVNPGASPPDPLDVEDDTGLKEHAAELLKPLQKHKRVRWATWQSTRGAFRVYTVKKSLKYKTVSHWKRVLENESSDAIKRSMAECCDALLGELDEDEELLGDAPAEDAPEPTEAAAAAGA